MHWIIAILLTVAYAAVAEYVAHRWVMHVPGLGRNHVWQNHAVEHHKKGRLDLNIGLAPATALLVLSPWFAACLWYGWAWAAYLCGASIAYGWLWTSIHAAIHGVDCLWFKRVPGFGLWARHHAKHHEQPFRNFGAVFIFTDLVFRTSAK